MLGSFDLFFVFFGLVAQFHDLGVSEQRVAVEGNLGVEHPQMTVLHDDQRIDLQQAHILADEDIVQQREELHAILTRRTVEFEGIAQFRRISLGDPCCGIDADGVDFLRRFLGHRLDIHAALGGGDKGDQRGFAVDEDGEVELAVDIGAIFQIEPVDLLAFGAGLLGDQRVTQHLGDMGFHFISRMRQPDATLGIRAKFLEAALAAPACMDLALHHVERAGQFTQRLVHITRRQDGHALGHGRSVIPQQRLGLIFVNIHS